MDTPDPVTRLNAALQGRYAIEREIGEGAMATVYLAYEAKHDRPLEARAKGRSEGARMKRKSLLVATVLGQLAGGQLAGQEVERAYQQACDSGDMMGCTNLGYLYATGEGVTQDVARAASLFREACDGENMLGCGDLGMMYAAGEGVTEDLVRAASLLHDQGRRRKVPIVRRRLHPYVRPPRRDQQRRVAMAPHAPDAKTPQQTRQHSRPARPLQR